MLQMSIFVLYYRKGSILVDFVIMFGSEDSGNSTARLSVTINSDDLMADLNQALANNQTGELVIETGYTAIPGTALMMYMPATGLCIYALL